MLMMPSELFQAAKDSLDASVAALSKAVFEAQREATGYYSLAKVSVMFSELLVIKAGRSEAKDAIPLLQGALENLKLAKSQLASSLSAIGLAVFAYVTEKVDASLATISNALAVTARLTESIVKAGANAAFSIQLGTIVFGGLAAYLIFRPSKGSR